MKYHTKTLRIALRLVPSYGAFRKYSLKINKDADADFVLNFNYPTFPFIQILSFAPILIYSLRVI